MSNHWQDKSDKRRRCTRGEVLVSLATAAHAAKDPEVEVGQEVLDIKRVRRTKKREVIVMRGRVEKIEKLQQK